MAFGPAAGLEIVDALTSEPALESYHLLPSVRGDLLTKLGRLDEAEAYLKESLSEGPRFPKAHFQLGLLLEKQKKEGDAIRELKEASAYDPSYPEPYFVLGRIYQRMGEEKNAQVAYGAFQKLSAIQKQKAVHRLH